MHGARRATGGMNDGDVEDSFVPDLLSGRQGRSSRSLSRHVLARGGCCEAISFPLRRGEDPIKALSLSLPAAGSDCTRFCKDAGNARSGRVGRYFLAVGFGRSLLAMNEFPRHVGPFLRVAPLCFLFRFIPPVFPLTISIWPKNFTLDPVRINFFTGYIGLQSLLRKILSV